MFKNDSLTFHNHRTPTARTKALQIESPRHVSYSSKTERIPYQNFLATPIPHTCPTRRESRSVSTLSALHTQLDDTTRVPNYEHLRSVRAHHQISIHEPTSLEQSQPHTQSTASCSHTHTHTDSTTNTNSLPFFTKLTQSLRNVTHPDATPPSSASTHSPRTATRAAPAPLPVSSPSVLRKSNKIPELRARPAPSPRKRASRSLHSRSSRTHERLSSLPSTENGKPERTKVCGAQHFCCALHC